VVEFLNSVSASKCLCPIVLMPKSGSAEWSQCLIMVVPNRGKYLLVHDAAVPNSAKCYLFPIVIMLNNGSAWMLVTDGGIAQ